MQLPRHRLHPPPPLLNTSCFALHLFPSLPSMPPRTPLSSILAASFSTTPRRPRPHTLPLTNDERSLFSFLRRAAAAISTSTSTSVELRVAGGWVRDKLLSRPTSDIDIAVRNISGTAFATHLQTFVQRRVALTPSIGPPEFIPTLSAVILIDRKPDISRHLETAAVTLHGFHIDFVHLRTEHYTQPNTRVPTVVTPATPTEDAHRRDFTVNALFYNLHSARVEDFTTRGLADLCARVLRTPDHPAITLAEDPLRALRALRFSAQLDFQLTPDLKSALSDSHLHTLLAAKVSRERIGNEVDKMIAAPHALRALHDLRDAGLAQPVFGPDLNNFSTAVSRVRDVLQLAHDTLPLLQERDATVFQDAGRPALVFAALCWDTRCINAVLGTALRRSRRLQTDVRAVILLSIRLKDILSSWMNDSVSDNHEAMDDGVWVDIAEVFREAGENLWMSVLLCTAIRTEKFDMVRDVLAHGFSARVCHVEPAVDGFQLQRELAIAPGPDIGVALREIVRIQLAHIRSNVSAHIDENNINETLALSSDECIRRLRLRKS